MDTRLTTIDNQPEIAMYHYYFTEAIFEHIKNDPDVLGLFGIGQDDFIMQIMPYTQLFYLGVDDCFIQEGALPGVAQFELPETLAIIFWEQCNISKGEFPDLDTFNKAARSLCADWCARGQRAT